MLSRTASNLYWIARYMERAETAARLLEVGARIALLPNTHHGYRNEWESLLQATGGRDAFGRKYDEANPRNMESHLFFDRDNPSSVASCITQARENARIVRTALTQQVWDALNTAFQELRQLERQPRSELELSRLIDWTNRHAAMVRGAIEVTLLRDDGHDFLHLGYNLERADSTARFLDVKYYVLLPKLDFVGSGLDNYQWTTILRAMGAHRSFHWAYGGEVTAPKIARFLILDERAPRALITSVCGMHQNLERLAKHYSRSGLAQVQAFNLLQQLRDATVESIIEEGMHDFLTRFIREIAGLSATIHEAYLSGDAR